MAENYSTSSVGMILSEVAKCGNDMPWCLVILWYLTLSASKARNESLTLGLVVFGERFNRANMIGRNNKEMFPAGWSDIMKDNSLRILHKEKRKAKKC